jgi:alkylation response protein AidB-like acyl-CoA dehydrogenase
MNILPTEDQEQIASSVVDVLRDLFPLERLRPEAGKSAGNSKGKGGDCSPERWSAMAELGWFGLGLDEEAGGVGFSLTDEMLVFRLLGRHLVTPNVLAAVLGARIAARAGAGEICAGILAGEIRPALAVAKSSVQLDECAKGEVYLLDAEHSSLAVLWNDERAVLLECERLSSRRTVDALDGSVPLAVAAMQDIRPLAAVAESAEAIDLRATVHAAAMLVGNAEATRDMAVEYAKTREQFGQPIGAFQAIKHRCADMAVQCEAAWNLTVMAAIAARDGHADAPRQAAAAKLLALRAAQANAAANIQIHGAMGFSAECDAHHFLKRAHLLEHAGGGRRKLERMVLT